MSDTFVYAPPQDPPEIVFRDDTLLVINKPSGLLSVPGKAPEHRDCLETRVKSVVPQALLVHRLDMDTSGLMLFALTRGAQRNFGRQFEKRVVEKEYIARVEGVLEQDAGEIDLPLIVDWPNRPLQKVDHETGKPAQTKWQVLAREAVTTVVRLRPKTGRSHQLRVHMLALGHPILGDRFYGTKQGILASPRLQLHARFLRIIHPATGDRLELRCDCPFYPIET